MTRRCSTCSMPLVVVGDRDICPRPACPGNLDLAATSSCAANGASLAAAGISAASDRATDLHPDQGAHVTILSARACAALARRKTNTHPQGITQAALLTWLQQAGADHERARRGIDLAIVRGWLERHGDTLTVAHERERAA